MQRVLIFLREEKVNIQNRRRERERETTIPLQTKHLLNYRLNRANIFYALFCIRLNVVDFEY